MVDKRMVRQLLKSYFKTTGKITIYDEGLVSCTGNVILKSQKQHTRLPLAFSEVGRNFHSTNNKLTTLEGLPAVSDTLYLSYSPILPLLRCLLAKKVEFVPKLLSTVGYFQPLCWKRQMSYV